MSGVYVDTSAFLALLNGSDTNHARAIAARDRLSGEPIDFLTNNNVLVETFALIQARLGLTAVRDFQLAVVPLLRVVCLAEDDQRRALEAMMTAGQRRLSLVDCCSFDTMRRLDVERVFCFGDHFSRQGFKTIP
jgi:predicted nucleic acid-binding protein